MLENLPILTALILLPLLGAAMVMVWPMGPRGVAVRWATLLVALLELALSLRLWFLFDPASLDYQFVEQFEWISAMGTGYHVGVDGISLLLILLSTLLTPICILACWSSITERVRSAMAAFLLLEAMMVGTFVSLDLILFYIFFEGVLIPMFLIIGIWGGARRIYAAYKFFLYTLAGSVFMLLAVLVIAMTAGTTDLVELATLPTLPTSLQTWLWLAFFASFAVKVPMWPFHTWLPDAHVEAPTAGSVILAGVLLKMGGYGFLRLSLPLLPDASVQFTPLIMALSLMAIVVTSLIALAQKDMKKLIAYSSVAHMGFVTIGLFSGNLQGMTGAVFQMISHGLVSGALFLCVGVLYDRMHTREIARFGGVVSRMPKYAIVFMLFTFATIGLPGTSGFVGEMLVLVGAYHVRFWVAALAATGIILAAAYSLWLYARVMFGVPGNAEVKKLIDLSPREVITFLPLVAGVLWLGIYPGPVLNVLQPAVLKILQTSQMVMEGGL